MTAQFADAIQVIDHAAPDAAQRFAASLKDTGFAVLNPHPIPPALMTEVYHGWSGFFASETKHEYTHDPEIQEGYFPFRCEQAKDSSIMDLKEFFHVYPHSPVPETVEQKTRQLYNALLELGLSLLGWLEQHTPEDVRQWFSKQLPEMMADSAQSLFRILHYPPLDGHEEVGAVRAAAHEDINLITLLVAGTESGLQVKDASGEWQDVPCDPGSVVVNSGDMLQECSRHHYPSTTHRVVNPGGSVENTSRYSMPFFVHPHPETVLSEHYTARSYLQQRLQEIRLK